MYTCTFLHTYMCVRYTYTSITLTCIFIRSYSLHVHVQAYSHRAYAYAKLLKYQEAIDDYTKVHKYMIIHAFYMWNIFIKTAWHIHMYIYRYIDFYTFEYV
jgi:hypothetical protein